MRAKLVHHAAEWLAGDYEAPPELARRAFLTVWHIDRDPRSGLTAMKVNRGAGVWDLSGRLLFYSSRDADLAWSRSHQALYSLEMRFGPCANAVGVAHALRSLEPRTFELNRQMMMCVPMGAVEYLVIDHAGNTCLATWLDQTQWGYVAVDLTRMSQIPGGLYFPTASLAPPAFSPDDAFVVSCSRHRSGWWTDAIDDYWDNPSPGGPRKVGTISVHHIASNAISHHDVFVRLPPGWLPEKAAAAEWSTIWGPEFVSDQVFRIWLPDDSSEELRLPLPERVEIKRPIATTRPWLD